MRRRAFLATGLSLPLMLGVGGRELLRLRRARFEEIGESVLLSVSIPELLPARERDAMASIESGFATTLAFEIKLYRTGSSAVLARHTRVVKIQWNPWKERYSVQIRDPGRGPSTRYFSERAQAIEKAVSIERFRIAMAADIDRGRRATYFVTVVGQRNPLDEPVAEAEPTGGRGQGRDLSAFSRWIGIFIKSAPKAEKTVAIRSSPAFYLLPK